MDSKKKWFPYNKGGSYRKWFGNNELVVNWQNEGEDIINNGMNSFRGKSFYFKEGITWSFTGSNKFAVRYKPNGFIFDIQGSSAFPEKSEIYNFDLKYEFFPQRGQLFSATVFLLRWQHVLFLLQALLSSRLENHTIETTRMLPCLI